MAAPPIQKLEHWTLISSDLARTRRWYAEVLGAAVVDDSNRPPCLELAGTLIDIFPSGGVTPAGLSLEAPAPGSIGQHHAYVVELQDFDDWVAHLKAIGQKHRLTAHGLGRMSIYVDDPDGYHIELTVAFDDLEKGRHEIEKRGLLDAAMKPIAF
jgi:catechol 2,3-dioxygenase-like lactoylglutathione lyase family enzyme